MTRLAAALLLVAASLGTAACGTGGSATGSPAASGCIPTYLVADARRLVTIVDAADRTNETTGGSLELDLASARLSILDGPASLATDTTTLDRLIGDAEAVLAAASDGAAITLARLAPERPLSPEPFRVNVPAGSYAIAVAPVVEFEVIIDGCPNAAGQIGKATIRINPIPSDALGISRRCTESPVSVEWIAAESKKGGRFEGYANAVTQPELDGLHAARCAS